MKTKMEQYAKLKADKELLEGKIKEAKVPFQEEIATIDEAMKTATEDMSTILSQHAERIKQLSLEIIDEWEGPPTAELEDGTKIVRSALKSVNVLDRRELLGTLISLVQDDEKLPFTVKWNNKGIIPLIDTNIIPADVATIETSYRLSVKQPKE